MMNAIDDLGLVLVEFDSVKGPVIRKSKPENNELVIKNLEQDLLMWILRATEFSSRKIEKKSVFARAIELDDPNFHRRKRQFGLALITSQFLDVTKAEFFLSSLIKECEKKCNNQSYFRMLNNLLQTIGGAELSTERFDDREKVDVNNKINIQTQIMVEENENSLERGDIPQLLISNRMQTIKLFRIKNLHSNYELLVGHPEAYDIENKKLQKLGYTYEGVAIEIEVLNNISNGIQQGMDIIARVINAKKNFEELSDRVLSSIELFDRLLTENVDIEYYLPFIQYLISMETYTFTEFKMEPFEKHLDQLKETHGEWINCLVGNELEGKRLNEFFQVTGVKREALELLIDLLFTKIVTIF